MATNTNPFYTYSATAGSSKTLQKPQDGGDNNQWGNYINTDLDEIVAAVNALSDKIADASENTLVDFTATTDAVNHVGVTNAATGNGPTISTAGTDSNVDLNVTPKGTGDSVFTNKIKVDDVVEKTTDHGVEIEGVTLKDGGGTFTSNVIIPDGGNLGSASDTDAITIGSSGKVGIGTTASDKLQVKGSISAEATNSTNRHLLYTHTDNSFRLNYNDSSDQIVVDSSGNVELNTGNLIIGTAGKGINFHPQGASDVNLLSDYEEGTWSPTIGSTSGSLTTVSTSNAVYTKIGRFVSISVRVNITTVGSASGAMTITLPFSPANDDFSGSGNERTSYGFSAMVFGEGSVLHIRKYDFSSAMANSSGLKISASYITS